eukprot:6458654-Alexandrium_andersonii.AAC.1
MAPTPEHTQLLLALQDGSHIEHVASGRWRLTSACVQKLVACTTLSEPFSLFEVRAGIALKDRTSFECLCILRSAGWVWNPWVPKRMRRGSALAIPDGYMDGAPKIMYTTRCASRLYLQALLQAPATTLHTLSMTR